MTLEEYYEAHREEFPNQLALAEKLNLKAPYLSLLLAQKRIPSDDLKKKIQEASDGEITIMSWF